MIYGLIGENGAGKSTFMRIVMGLIAIDEGDIELFGQTGMQGLQRARRKMGQSIETPALYPELTARENLQVQAANGGVSEREIDDLLRLMNLGDTGRKKAKNFSLGMRQRPGLFLKSVFSSTEHECIPEIMRPNPKNGTCSSEQGIR